MPRCAHGLPNSAPPENERDEWRRSAWPKTKGPASFSSCKAAARTSVNRRVSPFHRSASALMTATYDSPLEVAKERIRIPDLWRELGLEGKPKKTCRCPFHEDRSPSFSIFDDGKGWKCHAGCGGGSIIDFLAKAKGLSDEEACIEILRRAGSNRKIVPIQSDQGGSPPCWNFRPWCHTPRK